MTLEQRLIRKRIRIGTNQSTKSLEEDQSSPLLIILARDVHPPTILSHIPFMAKQRKTPIMLLPGGQASVELGKALGIKLAAILLFRAQEDGGEEEEETKLHKLVDSFVSFAKTKLGT